MLYEDLEDLFCETSLGRVHYKRRRGSGAVVLFLHGFAASTQTWARLLEKLDSGLDVCLLDLLGHGKSDAPKVDYSVAIQVRMVSEFMILEGLGGCYLFGHSYGGWIAASIAQGKFEGRGVMLEDSVGLKDHYEDIARENRGEEFKEGWRREARMLGLDERVLESSLRTDRKEEYLTRESLGSIVKPALVLWGEQDSTIPIKYARLFNEYIAGSRLVVVKGAGHVPHYMHPEEVARAASEFIQDQARS